MTDLEVTIVCSSFYRPSEEQQKSHRKSLLHPAARRLMNEKFRA